MPKNSLMSFIPELYNEKIVKDNLCEIQGSYKKTMDEFLYKFMEEKFKYTKIVKRNCEQTILSIIKYSPEDIRIDTVRRFLGIGDGKILREVLDCYLALLKNLPISFYKIFVDNESGYMINLDECLEIYNNKFANYHLGNENIEKLIKACDVYLDDKKLEDFGYEPTLNKFLLDRFYKRNFIFIEGLLEEYQKKTQNEIELMTLANQFIIANRDLDVNYNMAEVIIKENFIIRENVVELDSFFTYFLNKYQFKMRIIKFVNLSLERLLNVYNSLDSILNKLWESADCKKQGIIFAKEFDRVIEFLMGNSEFKWKIKDYFKYFKDFKILLFKLLN